MALELKSLTAEELTVGLTAEYEREITESDVLAFATNSGDSNPLHVDADFARDSRFAQRLVHGAFQIGLASALIGMRLPGRDVLLGSVNARFISPLYFPGRVRVSGEIVAWNSQSRAGSVRVTIQDLGSHVPVSEIVMAFSLQGRAANSAAVLPAPTQTKHIAFPPGKKIVLVTGASGGIGGKLVHALAEEFAVLAMVHNRSLSGSAPDVVEMQSDFDAPGWEQDIRSARGENSLYAIIHCAWPGMPRGGLLNSDSRLIDQQLAFGTSYVVRLARLLFELSGEDGGRMIALGSVAGHNKPALGLGAYSLAKAALEDTVRLLAPELARRKISINAVCPTFVPTGMNAQADELQMKRETATVPMGRICDAQDIVGAVRYLLSPGASFVSGQSILISGAQL